MNLPPSDAPRYDELREWWVTYPDRSVRRLILEVQTLRDALARMRITAELALDSARAANGGRTLPRQDSLCSLHRQINEQLRRVGRIYPPPPRNIEVENYARSADAVAYETEGRRKRRMRNT
jgi:hypothetical protein